MKKSLLLSALAVAGLCASASAADVTVGADLKSAYVSSGITKSDSWVFCPWAKFSGVKVGDYTLPLVFGVTANYEVGNDEIKTFDGLRGECTRVDFWADVDMTTFWTPAEKLSWSLGYSESDYPVSGVHGGEADHLLVLKACYADAEYFKPTMTVKYRVAGANEGKCEVILGASKKFDLEDGLALTAAADVYFVRQADNSPLDNGLACATVTGKLTKGPYYVSLTYFFQLDDAVLTDAQYDEKFVLAAGVSYKF